MTTPQVQEMTPPQQVEELNPLRFEEVITRLNEMSRQQEELSRQQREVSRQLMELSTQRREVITQRREVIMRDMATIETGAEILQKKRHTIRECLFILVFFLYLASCASALNYQADLQGKNDETPRGYLWISSVVCLAIGTAFYIDIILASIRYKVPIGGPGANFYVFGVGFLALCSLL